MCGQTLCHRQQGFSQIRKCEGKSPDVEEALNQWFCIVTGRVVGVSDPMLKSYMVGHLDRNAGLG
jgi:hypothetical protein